MEDIHWHLSLGNLNINKPSNSGARVKTEKIKKLRWGTCKP
jgi:hypothetical protein